MADIYDVAIIGGGAGGLTTALYSTRAGLKVALIEKGLYGGQLHNTDVVENYSAFNTISGEDLAEAMEEQMNKQDNITEIYGEVINVTKVGSSFKTEFRGKDDIYSKTLVIATGVKHKKLGVPGESKYNGHSLSYCATCDGTFFKNESVAVIGGGDSAVESALYLENIVKDVTLVYRGSKLRAEQILQDRMNSKDNIKVLWNAETEAVKGDDDKITHLVYLDKKDGNKYKLPVNGVFVNVGMIPVTNVFRNIGVSSLLDEFGFVLNNPKTMETEVDGLFAVGDVRADSVRQVSSAVGDGAIAGINVKKYLETI